MKACKTKKYENGGTVDSGKKPKSKQVSFAIESNKAPESIPMPLSKGTLYTIPQAVGAPTGGRLDFGYSSNDPKKTPEPKVKLKNPRQRKYITGGSSSALKSKTNNAKKGMATSNSKTCTTLRCPK